MRRTKLLSLFLAGALVFAACGDDDDAAPENTDDASQTADDTSSDDMADDSSDDMADDDMADDDMADDSSDDMADLTAAQAMAGDYTGSWENTTFGSTGDASATVTVGDDGAITIVLDLGGGVFGGGDPEPQTLEGTTDGTTASLAGTTDLFGDYTIDIADDGTFTFDAPAVPADGIASMTATGTLVDGVLSLDYVVNFDGGGDPAVGVITLTLG